MKKPGCHFSEKLAVRKEKPDNLANTFRSSPHNFLYITYNKLLSTHTTLP